MTAVLVFDIGTSKIKAGLYSENGEKLGESTRGTELIFPKNGWAEQDPNHWISVMNDMANKLLKIDNVEAIGITGQMIGLVPVNRNLDPIENAIIWLDSRANNEAEQILEKISLMDFLEITGGIPSGKDVVSKILWLKINRQDIFDKTAYFLDVKDFLIAKITNKIVTDISTASVRGLVDIRKKDYSEDILEIIGITKEKLPEIVNAKEIVGEGKDLFNGIPIVNGSGDAFVTPFGAGAVMDNKVHYYLGTSGWASTHTPEYLVNGERGIGSVLSVIPNRWLFISESESAGSCLDWFMENFGFSFDYNIIDKYVQEAAPGSNKLLFLPWLYGERSPILDTYARGGFINLSLSHSIREISRSIFEGIAMNTRWMLSGIMESGIQFKEVNAVGGGAKSDIWMQILSDITGFKINKMEDPQNATLKGIALISLLSLGKIKNYYETENFVNVNKIFEPNTENRGVYDELFENFKNIYESLKGIFENLNGRGDLNE